MIIAVLPILWLLFRYLPDRIRWIGKPGPPAARRLVDSEPDLHLFALRAVATRPLSELERVVPDPMSALGRGDYARLAALELRELGLGIPSTERQAVA